MQQTMAGPGIVEWSCISCNRRVEATSGTDWVVGPYVCLRNQYQWGPLGAVDFEVKVFDAFDNMLVGQESYLGFAFGNLGDEILLSGTALPSGRGYMEINFSATFIDHRALPSLPGSDKQPATSGSSAMPTCAAGRLEGGDWQGLPCRTYKSKQFVTLRQSFCRLFPVQIRNEEDKTYCCNPCRPVSARA